MNPHNSITPEQISRWRRAGPRREQQPHLFLDQIEAAAAELARIACDTAQALARHFHTAADSQTMAADLADTARHVRHGLDATDISPTTEVDRPGGIGSDQ